jgi:hypothetical protein
VCTQKKEAAQAVRAAEKQRLITLRMNSRLTLKPRIVCPLCNARVWPEESQGSNTTPCCQGGENILRIADFPPFPASLLTKDVILHKNLAVPPSKH